MVNFIGLMLFPMLILSVDVLMQQGNLTGSVPNVCFSQSNTSCSQNGGQVTFTCIGPTPCQISSDCSSPLPPPAYCFLGVQWIGAGTTLTTNAKQVSQQGVFAFGSIGISGFVGMIAVAVAVAVLAGVTIFGSGLNQASIRIFFIGGLLMGLWFYFSTLEGFVSNNSASLFVQLNSMSTTWNIVPVGTVFYIILTLMETAGVITMISRAGD